MFFPVFGAATIFVSQNYRSVSQLVDFTIPTLVDRGLQAIAAMDVLAHMMPRSRVLAAGVHLPLKKLALCLDCDECFELGYATCPACGSSTWSPLGRFLDIAGGARPARGNGATRRILPRRAAEELAIAKHLLVVARHRRELYEEIKRAFAGHESVQVILDRRTSQRREKKGGPMLDRRRNERRARSVIDEQLRTIGWSLVLLDLAKSGKS